MNSKTILFFSVIVGVICGLLATYPISLRLIPSFAVWGIGGLIVGLFAQDKKSAIHAGTFYGIAMCISFLISRYGGGTNKALGYFILILVLSLFGALGGVIASFMGFKIKSLKK